MVRHNGKIMSDTRYRELTQQEMQVDYNFIQRLNLYFFGVSGISLADWIWFYGSMALIAVIVLSCWIIAI